MKRLFLSLITALALSVSLLQMSAAFADSGDDGNFEFKGAIESFPGGGSFIGDWIIGGSIVHVISSTRIKQQHGAMGLGVQVKVKGI